jgi:hypothetical protein
VRNDTCAQWSDEDVFRCLAWIYDGFPLPTDLGRAHRATERHAIGAG